MQLKDEVVDVLTHFTLSRLASHKHLVEELRVREGEGGRGREREGEEGEGGEGGEGGRGRERREREGERGRERKEKEHTLVDSVNIRLYTSVWKYYSNSSIYMQTLLAVSAHDCLVTLKFS